MDRLSAPEGRVLAALVEKALTVPQYYPLTLNALVVACNQTSSRDPVTSYAESEVLAALESLREKRLVRVVLPSHGRSAVRYRHVLDETLGLDVPQLAVLSLLELRGPQTVAELRARSERMADIGTVDHELELLSTRTDPLVVLLGRRPGEKQDRWTSCLSDAPPRGDAGIAHGDARIGAGGRGDAPPGAQPVPTALEAELAEVRAELADLRRAVDVLGAAVTDLRDSLGG